MATQEKKTLHSIIYKSFLKTSLIPIFVIEIALLLLYFGINAYISSKNLDTLLNEAKFNLNEISKKEAKIIDGQLSQIDSIAKMLQKEHQTFFQNPNNFTLPNAKPNFAVASNGVFYKTNKIGSSVYYSSKTKITPKEIDKAVKTEYLDMSFQNIIQTHPNIVAVYLNTWDDMNRLYPFIDDVAKQYGPHIHMEDFNFYYLADAKHNPQKTPVWTGAYLDPAGNGWMASCIVPIYNGSFLEGVTGLDITIDAFIKNILNLDLPWDAKAFLVDKDGAVLAMPKEIESIIGFKEIKKQNYNNEAITTTIDQSQEFNIFKNKDVKYEIKNLIEKNLSMAEMQDDNNKYLLVQKEIASTKWKLIILADESKILHPIYELKSLSNQIGYGAIIVMLIFYGGFFLFLTTKSKKLADEITKPVEALTSYIKNIGSANTKENQNFDAGIAEIDFIASFSKQIQRVNNEFYETNLKLEDLNKNLAEKVKEEVDKNRDKEALLIQQSKMAAMGEMISSIVHQWKQPLNAISMAVSSLQFRSEFSEVTKEDLEQSTNLINVQVEHMSKTMTDFKNFFKASSKESYNLDSCFRDAMKLVESIFYSKNVQVQIQSQGDIVCVGHANETIQVFLNVLNNARDALIVKEIEPKIIYVNIEKQNDLAIVLIKDFAGGILDDVLDRIFEPYFSTKGEKGTGIGLYMSKTIVEKAGGELLAQNIQEELEGQLRKGVVFTIKLPLA